MQQPDLRHIIYSSIEGLRVHIGSEIFSSKVYESFFRFHHVIEHIGEMHYVQHKEGMSYEIAEVTQIYYWTFIWPEEVKQYLVLWRNSLLELSKANFYLTKDLNDFHERIFNTLNAASVELVHNSSAAAIEKSVAIKCLKTQINPWRNYLKQFEKIENQFSEIHSKYKLLKICPELFDKIYSTLAGSLEKIHSNTHEFHQTAHQFIEQIYNASNDTSVLLEELEKKEDKVKEQSLNSKAVISQLESYIEMLPQRMEIPVDTRRNNLLMRDIDLRFVVDKWIGSEILPLAYEVWELNEELENKLMTSLINLKNQYSILQVREKPDIDSARLALPLEKFSAMNEKQRLEIKNFTTEILKRLEENFSFFEVFNTHKRFLNFTNENNSNGIDLYESPLLKLINGEFKKIKNFVDQTINRKSNEKFLTPSERIAKYLDGRILNTNGHYANIFLTKGYTAQSFWIKRKESLKRVESAINDWKNGYKGSTLLVGQRNSGKTVFGDMVFGLNKDIPGLTLSPEKEFTYGGRKFKSSFDLRETLSIIKNNTSSQKVMIWIDDFEKWRDKEITVYDNYLALSHFINENSTNFYCLVSFGSLMWNRIQSFENDLNTFHTTVNLDVTSVSDLKTVLELRHGATHTKLINAKREEINFNKATSYLTQIWKYTGGNIGDALNAWVYGLHETGENEIIISSLKYLPLPKEVFLGKRRSVLFYIALYKAVTDHELSLAYGENYKEETGEIVASLIAEKIIVRRSDHFLEINEVLQNDLIRELSNPVP